MVKLSQSQLEQFLFSPDQEEFVNQKMIPNTEAWSFLKLLVDLKKHGSGIKQESKNLLNECNGKSEWSRQLFLRYQLLRLESEQNDEKSVQDIIKTINEAYLKFDAQQYYPVIYTEYNEEENENDIEEIFDPENKIKSTMDQAYTQIVSLNELTSYAIQKMDLIKVAQDSPLNIVSKVMSCVNLAQVTQTPQIIEILSQRNFGVDFLQMCGIQLNKLTLQQIEDIFQNVQNLKTHDNIVNYLINNKFQIDGNSKNKEQLIKTREQLLKKYRWIQTLDQKYMFIALNELISILQLDVQTNQYDFKLFEEYLQKKSFNFDQNNLQNQVQNNIEQTLILKQYLQAYFRQY